MLFYLVSVPGAAARAARGAGARPGVSPVCWAALVKVTLLLVLVAEMPTLEGMSSPRRGRRQVRDPHCCWFLRFVGFTRWGSRHKGHQAHTPPRDAWEGSVSPSQGCSWLGGHGQSL